MIEESMLWQAAELELSCARSSDGQTTQARTTDGQAVATSDGAGTIADSGGAVLLRTKIEFPKRGNSRMEIADGDGQPLGSVTLGKFRFGPKALRATLSVTDPDGTEIARFEPRDKKGHDVAIFADGETQIGTLRQTGHDRGLRRSTTTYRLGLDPADDPQRRALVLATALRHQALLVAARNHNADR